jgi:hypothetical protein
MDTSNSNTNEPTQLDPLAIALTAIDRYDNSRLDSRTSPGLLDERYRVAQLRTAYAQAAELRAIRNMLAGAYTLFVAEMQERNDDAA